MSGTVNIARALWDDPDFPAEPFSQREAWIWMIAEASWKPRTRRVGDYIVELQRGQLAGSVRYLAGVWGWSPAKVQRFIERVRSMKMIQTKTDTGVTVVTICNYDDYQRQAQAADTGPIQDRYRTDTKQKKGERRGKEGEDISEAKASSPRATKPNRFADFWAAYPHRGGAKRKRKDAEASYARAVAKGIAEQVIIDGATAAHSDRQVRAGFARDPTTWLNQCGWDDEIEPDTPQLPSMNGGARHDRASETTDYLAAAAESAFRRTQRSH